MAQVLHLTGPVLVGPDDVRPQAWVVGGRITYAAPTGDHDVTTVSGWVLPGLVDAHSHIGLGAHGAVDDATAEEQALADRDAGALLLRDAGSPADTRWVQARDDLPRLVRAGRHIARTRRYIRNFAWEVEPEQLVEQVRLEARAGDGWVKLVGDWIDRDTGDLSPCWPAEVLAEAVAAAHEEGARVTAHCFGEQSLRDLAAAGTDCVEHACGLEPDTIASFADRGIAIVPTLVNISTFPQIAEPAREKFPAYYRPHDRPATSGGTRRSPTHATPASRSTSARMPVARCRTGWSRPRWRTSRTRGSRRPRPSPPRAGGRAPGSAGPGSRRAWRPTWSSTPTTRARTSPRWPARRSSSCAAARSPDPPAPGPVEASHDSSWGLSHRET